MDYFNQIILKTVFVFGIVLLCGGIQWITITRANACL